MLEKTTRMNLLYDFYHSLLTDKQKQVMELYYGDDLSLSEIAEHCQISRQAVFEHIKRAERLLNQYESQLQMVAKYEKRHALLDKLESVLAEASAVDVRQVRHLLDELRKTD